MRGSKNPRTFFLTRSNWISIYIPQSTDSLEGVSRPQMGEKKVVDVSIVPAPSDQARRGVCGACLWCTCPEP